MKHGKQLQQDPSNVNDKIQGRPNKPNSVVQEPTLGLMKAYLNQLRNLSTDLLDKSAVTACLCAFNKLRKNIWDPSVMPFSIKNEAVGPNFYLTETATTQSNIWGLIPLFCFWIPTLYFLPPGLNTSHCLDYSAAVISKCAEGDVLKQERANVF